jgi:hypothetical protein
LYEEIKPNFFKLIFLYLLLIIFGILIGFLINQNKLKDSTFKMYEKRDEIHLENTTIPTVIYKKHDSFSININQNESKEWKDFSFEIKNKEIEKDYKIGLKEWKDSTFKMYEKRADIYLKNIKTPIKPTMLSLAAYNVYDSLGILVPLELALAQAVLESSLGTKGRSSATNPFNVGEYNSKTVLKFDNTFDGVQAYYFLIAKKYLKCKNINILLKNFTNCNGKRYASSLSYEIELTNTIKKITKKIDKGLMESEINKF